MAVKPDAAVGEMQFLYRLPAAERIDQRIADRLRGDTRRTAVGGNMHQMRMHTMQIAGINAVLTGFNTRMHLPVGTGIYSAMTGGKRVVLRLGGGCIARQRQQCVAAAWLVRDAEEPGAPVPGEVVKMMTAAFFALCDAYTCPQQQVAEGVVVFGAKERDGFVEDEVHEGSPDNKKAGETNPRQGKFPLRVRCSRGCE